MLDLMNIQKRGAEATLVDAVVGSVAPVCKPPSADEVLSPTTPVGYCKVEGLEVQTSMEAANDSDCDALAASTSSSSSDSDDGIAGSAGVRADSIEGPA
eukprot:s3084_g8.t1